MKAKHASDIVIVALLALIIMLSNAIGSMRCNTIGGGKPPEPNGVGSIEEYEARIGEAGLLIEDDNIQMWVPKKYETHARVIFSYLQAGYTVLCEIFGGHDMPTKFSIEHYPEGSPYWMGGTDAPERIMYGYNNLEDDFPEWNQYGVPHMIGYYEEMAHCFIYDMGKFGFYEALGMMIGQETGMRAAWNPYLNEFIANGFRDCAETTAYYLDHNAGSPDLPANIWLTRVLVHIFKVEVVDRYGWKAFTDAFAQMRREGFPLRWYDYNHVWGGFLTYLSSATGTDMHSVFASYGLPLLEWTDETGYENDGVELVDKNENKYSFRIRCFDREGTEPAQVMLHLYSEGLLVGETNTMSLVGGSAENGWIYEAVVSVDEPEYYSYAFSAKDGLWDIFQAVGNLTMKRYFVINERSFIQAFPTSQNVSLGEGVMIEGLLYHIKASDVWKIGYFDSSSSEFDSNMRDDPEVVIFTIGQSTSIFPDGLGTDIGPQRSKIEVIFNYDSNVEQAEFRIRWNPGGSEAQEQFTVLLNGSNLGSSKTIRGSEHPYEWRTEVFNATIPRTGKYNLTLVHNQGDGIYIDALRFQALEKIGIGNAKVYIEYVAPNMTSFIRTVRTTTTGLFDAVLALDMPGTWMIGSSWEGNADYLSSESTNVSLEVIRQYRLSITSDFGNVNGEGLYDEGSSAMASVDRKEVPAEDLFHIYVFVGWSGDASGTSQTSNPILMDGPKTAIAIWEKQLSTTVYAIVGGIVILALCSLFFILRRRR